MANSSINPLAGAENFPAILTKPQAAAYVQSTPRYLERAVKAGPLRALNPWLRATLWEAREKQADYLAQNTIDLEQSLLAEPEKLTMSIVQAHKVVMDNRHWYTGKVLKRVYGDDAAVNVDARTAVVVSDEQIKELRSRLNDARKLVKQSGKGDAEP